MQASPPSDPSPLDAPPPDARPQPAAPSTPGLRQTARRLLPFFWPQRWGLVLTMLAYLGAAATEPLIPALIQKIFGDGFSADAFAVWWVPVVLVGLFVLRGIFSFLGQYLLNWTSSRTVMRLRLALVDALLADARLLAVFGFGTWYILKLMSKGAHSGETDIADNAPIRTAGITPGPAQNTEGQP